MQLQREFATALAGGSLVHTRLAVEPRANVAADRFDFVVVPVALLEKRLAGFIGQNSPAVLFVQLAPPAGADVGLVAAHFVETIQRFGAELHAAVALVVDQLEIERQAGNFSPSGRSAKTCCAESRAAAHDFAVFDRPQFRLARQPVRSLPLKKLARIVFRR